MATIATVSFNGELVLPAEIQCTLGIAPGLRVEIAVHGQRLEITASEQPPMNRERARKALQNLQAMYTGQPSLEDEYFRTRDKGKW